MTATPVVLPRLTHVDPAGLRRGHIVRVTDSDVLAATDAYGIVRGVKRYPGGSWRIRWEAATTTAEPTGILHVPAGTLVACASREQWKRMVHRTRP